MTYITSVKRLGVIMRPEWGELTEAWGVLNPAAARGRDGALYLFARVVAEGNISRIRMARVIFNGEGVPTGVKRMRFALEPREPYEGGGDGSLGGCEDPRITYIAALDRYVMTYTACGPTGAHVALAISTDLFAWERLGVVEFGEQDGIDFDCFEDKDAVIFPEPVVAPDGTAALACMHRPMTGLDQDLLRCPELVDLPASIWVSYVPLAKAQRDVRSLARMRQHRLVARPTNEWEQIKMGGGAPPVLTSHGWLLLYHGVEDHGRDGQLELLRYSTGALLINRHDVRRVIWRSPVPIMVAETEDEIVGIVNNVVFPTGVDVGPDGHIDVYYGMADTCIGVARMWLREGLDARALPIWPTTAHDGLLHIPGDDCQCAACVSRREPAV
jgi:predicted GH43/DUF377 family glycosyl hydrolase